MVYMGNLIEFDFSSLNWQLQKQQSRLIIFRTLLGSGTILKFSLVKEKTSDYQRMVIGNVVIEDSSLESDQISIEIEERENLKPIVIPANFVPSDILLDSDTDMLFLTAQNSLIPMHFVIKLHFKSIQMYTKINNTMIAEMSVQSLDSPIERVFAILFVDYFQYFNVSFLSSKFTFLNHVISFNIS